MTDTCQIDSQEVEIQFMSCPGQPIETDRMSEVLGCYWYGTFDYYMLTYDGGQLETEWHFLMDVFFTLVFAGGSTLTEPSQESLLAHLDSLGYGLTPLSTSDRILIQLESPQICVFGAVFVLLGWVLDVLPLVSMGGVLVVLSFIVSIFWK